MKQQNKKNISQINNQQINNQEPTKLKNALSFIDIFFVGLGYIVGAGIYSLLSYATKYGGNFTWLSFIIGGFISLMTGLSYAELSRYFDSNASEYDYITTAISTKAGSLMGLTLVVVGIFTATTLALAFIDLLVSLIGSTVSYGIIRFLIIAIPTIINIIGVKFTTNLNMGISITESSTLIILILLSAYMGKWTPKAYTGGFNLPSIVHGAFITILALSGFEHLPKMAEETQNSSRNIPLAITSSLSIAAVMYALTSISANSVLGTKTVAKTINPISKTYSKLIGGKGESLVNVVSLFSIFNTVMLTMLFVSRQIYGIAKRGTFSSYFTKVNKITQTPIRSILFVSLCTFLLTSIKEVELSTHLTNVLLFSVFALVNLSAIILRYRGTLSQSENNRGINSQSENNRGTNSQSENNREKKENEPKKHSRFSIYSIIGLITSIYMVYSSMSNNYFANLI